MIANLHLLSSVNMLGILVLNWNNAPDTVACLSKISDMANVDHAIFVIDNGSTDDSINRIQEAHSAVPLIRTGQNLGYAGGNNYAIRRLLNEGFDYICILNNDVFIDNDSLKILVQLLETDPATGVATPLIGEIPKKKIVWTAGISINQRTGTVQRNGAGEPIQEWINRPSFSVDAVSGAAFVARREVWEKAGLFDENFFLYYEEVDWSRRVQEAGYKIMAVPQAVVWHKVSSTLGVASPLIDYYMLRNQLYFIGKHWYAPARWLLYARIALRNILAIFAFSIKSHEGKRLPNRNARIYALRDAALGRWGKMGADVAKICCPGR